MPSPTTQLVVDEANARIHAMGTGARAWLALCIIVVIGGVARFTGLNWDQGIGAHPDERYMVGVAESSAWPRRMDPLYVDPAYSYGHLPLYLLFGAIDLIPGADALLVARALASVASFLTVLTTFVLAREVGGLSSGLISAAIVAMTPLLVQQARFFTADVPLALCCMACLLFCVRLVREGRASNAAWAGILAGLAIACKAAGIWLAAPLAVACGLAPLPGQKREFSGADLSAIGHCRCRCRESVHRRVARSVRPQCRVPVRHRPRRH